MGTIALDRSCRPGGGLSASLLAPKPGADCERQARAHIEHRDFLVERSQRRSTGRDRARDHTCRSSSGTGVSYQKMVQPASGFAIVGTGRASSQVWRQSELRACGHHRPGRESLPRYGGEVTGGYRRSRLTCRRQPPRADGSRRQYRTCTLRAYRANGQSVHGAGNSRGASRGLEDQRIVHASVARERNLRTAARSDICPVHARYDHLAKIGPTNTK